MHPIACTLTIILEMSHKDEILASNNGRFILLCFYVCVKIYPSVTKFNYAMVIACLKKLDIT